MKKTIKSKKTPLYERHKALGGHLVEFAGYMMPIKYNGIIAEHQLVRNKAGLFDLSHMGELEIRGDNAVNFVNYVITNDISKIPQGAIVYTAICKDNGGILDDALAYKTNYGVYLVVNASNKDKIYRWFIESQKKWQNLKIEDVSEKTALIAIQGPNSEAILQKLTPVDLSKMAYYHFTQDKILNAHGIISRTGYTGEDGFEIYIANEDAESIWDALMLEGKPFGIKPIGLGARDTLRLESKYALYGNELTEDINPIEAGLKWVIKTDKEDFIGKYALESIIRNKPSRKLIGFKMLKPSIPRHGFKIYNNENEEIGFVTSGTHSPTLKESIGLALINKKYGKIGNKILVGIRNKKIPAKIVKTPFYKGSIKNK